MSAAQSSKKQEAAKSNTPNMGLFSTCSVGPTGFHLGNSNAFSEPEYAHGK
jgi:hypothetical protein